MFFCPNGNRAFLFMIFFHSRGDVTFLYSNGSIRQHVAFNSTVRRVSLPAYSSERIQWWLRTNRLMELQKGFRQHGCEWLSSRQRALIAPTFEFLATKLIKLSKEYQFWKIVDSEVLFSPEATSKREGAGSAVHMLVLCSPTGAPGFSCISNLCSLF